MQNNNNIWAISAVSFCWSAASMMVTSIFPLYLIEILHIGYAKIGYLEGVAVFCAFASKVLFGILSDWLQKRQLLILIGSILSVVTKPMLALSTNYNMIFISRFIDRFAKGIRSAPTDALIADLNPDNLGYAFGCRQAIYILGAVCGAGLSICLIYFMGPKYQVIFYMALIPAVLAVIILYIFVHDPVVFPKINLALDQVKSTQQLVRFNKKLGYKEFIGFIQDLQHFSSYYWAILVITFFLMIARFSESFLSLKVREFGWPIFGVPLIIIISDISHSYFAFIGRNFVTRIATEKLLITGLIVLILANMIWFLANSNLVIIIAIIFTGMHLGITQGVLRTLVAMSATNIRGTAFALFYLVSGCGVFIGNAIAGLLAEKFSLSYIFIGGMIASCIALIMVLALRLYRNQEYNLQRL